MTVWGVVLGNDRHIQFSAAILGIIEGQDASTGNVAAAYRTSGRQPDPFKQIADSSY